MRALLALLLLTTPATAQIFDQGKTETRPFQSPDIRYLRAYEGLALEKFRGWAIFAGPTLFWHATDNIWLSATSAFQVAGRERGTTDTYDLGNFPRQMLKFKIGMEF